MLERSGKDLYTANIGNIQNGDEVVRHPQLVWSVCFELAIDPVQWARDRLVRDRGAHDFEEAESINQGGAASNAYLRLQFEDLQPDARVSLRKGHPIPMGGRYFRYPECISLLQKAVKISVSMRI